MARSLDPQPDVRKQEKFQEYINLYADAGWESKGSYAGVWHYFRRPWQPGAAPELYTDRASLKQHYQRIQQYMGAALGSNLPLMVVSLSSLRSGGVGMHLLLALWVIVLVLLAYGCLRMSRKIRALSQGE